MVMHKTRICSTKAKIRMLLLITAVVAPLSMLDEAKYSLNLANDALVVEELNKGHPKGQALFLLDRIVDGRRDSRVDSGNAVLNNRALKAAGTKSLRSSESAETRFAHSTKGQALDQVVDAKIVHSEHSAPNLLSELHTAGLRTRVDA